MQIKDFLIRTIFAWCDIFKPENFLKVPIIKMELTFDDQRMQFYPSYETIQDLLASIVRKITSSLQGVS